MDDTGNVYEELPVRLELTGRHDELERLEGIMQLMQQYGVSQLHYGETKLVMPPKAMDARPLRRERKEPTGPTERDFAYAHAGPPPINILEAKGKMG